MSRGSATPVGSGGVADYSGTLQVRIKETSSKVNSRVCLFLFDKELKY